MDIAKRLPSALRAIPKGEEMTNPYIISRVQAHDTGKAAGKVQARTEKHAEKIVTPSKKTMVLKPFKALTDVVGNQYLKSDVTRGMATAQRMQARGAHARKSSRIHLTAHPSLNRPKAGPFGVQMTRNQHAKAA